jgi:hypothetical protein
MVMTKEADMGKKVGYDRAATADARPRPAPPSRE